VDTEEIVELLVKEAMEVIRAINRSLFLKQRKKPFKYLVYRNQSKAKLVISGNKVPEVKLAWSHLKKIILG
jgi:hypothetical protein